MVDTGISSDLIRGHIDTIVLKLLIGGDKYGYEISKLVRSGSNGEYELKEATLYSCLKRLEGEGKIKSYWGDETQGGRRKYYRVTVEGQTAYKEKKRRWEEAKRILDNLI